MLLVGRARAMRDFPMAAALQQERINEKARIDIEGGVKNPCPLQLLGRYPEMFGETLRVFYPSQLWPRNRGANTVGPYGPFLTVLVSKVFRRVCSTSCESVCRVKTLPRVASISLRMSCLRCLNPRPAMQATTS